MNEVVFNKREIWKLSYVRVCF